MANPPRPYGIGPYGAGPYSIAIGQVWLIGGQSSVTFGAAGSLVWELPIAGQAQLSFSTRLAATELIAIWAWADLTFSIQRAEVFPAWPALGPCETGGWSTAIAAEPGTWTPLGPCETGTWSKAA